MFHNLKATLKKRGLNTAVGDEGGFAPDLESNEAALQALIEGIEAAGYTPGDDVAIALDPAVSEIFKNGNYELAGESRTLSASELAAYWTDLAARYPILSIEDGMDEEDWDGWKALTDSIGDKVQLVGDDLFVTNVKRLQKGIDTGTANSILIKVNQIGTLTETLAAIDLARSNGYTRRHVAPLGRDRGHDDRRPRRRHGLRPDQDGRAVALGSRGQVQPAAAHRRGPGRRRRVPRPLRVPQLVRPRAVHCRGREPAASNERGRYGPPFPRDSLGPTWALGAHRCLRACAVPLHRACPDWMSTYKEAARQRQAVAEMRAENERLRERKAELSAPGAIEREARRLGMVKAGERAYIVKVDVAGRRSRLERPGRYHAGGVVVRDRPGAVGTGGPAPG